MQSSPPVIQAWVWVPARPAQWVTSAATPPYLLKLAPQALTRAVLARHPARAAQLAIIRCSERRNVISPLVVSTYLHPHKCPDTVIPAGIRLQARLHAHLYLSSINTHRPEPQRPWSASGAWVANVPHLVLRWELRFSMKEQILVS